MDTFDCAPHCCNHIARTRMCVPYIVRTRISCPYPYIVRTRIAYPYIAHTRIAYPFPNCVPILPVSYRTDIVPILGGCVPCTRRRFSMHLVRSPFFFCGKWQKKPTAGEKGGVWGVSPQLLKPLPHLWGLTSRRRGGMAALGVLCGLPPLPVHSTHNTYTSPTGCIDPDQTKI